LLLLRTAIGLIATQPVGLMAQKKKKKMEHSLFITSFSWVGLIYNEEFRRLRFGTMGQMSQGMKLMRACVKVPF